MLKKTEAIINSRIQDVIAEFKLRDMGRIDVMESLWYLSSELRGSKGLYPLFDHMSLEYPKYPKMYYYKLYHVYQKLVVELGIQKNDLAKVKLRYLFKIADQRYGVVDRISARAMLGFLSEEHPEEKKKAYLWKTINRLRSLLKIAENQMKSYDAAFVEEFLQINTVSE